MAKKPPKNMTSEDRYLWKKVTDTVKPRKKSSVDSALFTDEDLFANAIKNTEIFKGSKRLFEKNKSLKKAVAPKSLAIHRAPPELPPVLHMDRKAKSRLSRGLRNIDGRIDLHGMSQQQAYEALMTFIGRSRASGWKTVLVITGKGAQSLKEDQSTYYEMGREAPGVLRRKVPQWLSQPQMRQFVIGYDIAAPNHGGNGAYYVRIRKNK
ncbi:MAG: Smr/MutS family protein [Hyphomicrobiales bacterium]